MKDIIDTYFNEHLSPLLSRLGVSKEFKDAALDNVQIQVCSLCSHWDDLEFRNGIFVVGTEEGMFYEPINPINPFVVVAIRNSLLETIQSKDFKRIGLSRGLGDDSIKLITKQAIGYFGSINMDNAWDRFSVDPDEDLYGNVTQRYPIAWAALKKIGNTVSSAITYPKIECFHGPNLFDRFEKSNYKAKKAFNVITWDGYSDDIDEDLKGALNNAVSEGGFFIAESFKSVTRNFEKLLCVMEYLLCNRSAFVTCNYYISNGYVAKRSPILRPGHIDSERRENLKNLSGIRKTHREVISKALKEMEIE